jgi:hypothetical protein
MTSLSLVDLGNRTMAKRKRKWIQKAIPESHEGRLRAKAERAGESTREFARAHEHDSGKTGAQSRLALTLMGMSHKKRRLSDTYKRKD